MKTRVHLYAHHGLHVTRQAALQAILHAWVPPPMAASSACPALCLPRSRDKISQG